MKRYLILLAVLSFAFALCAEEIHLKDGTKISGQIIGTTSDKFQIKTAYGDIQVPRSAILSIEFPENQPKDVPPAKPVYDEDLSGRIYKNRSENIQLTAPDGWTLAPKYLSKDIHGALRSEDDTAFLFITPEKFKGALSTYQVVVETQLQGKFKDFEKLSQSEVKLDGHPAMRIVWHGSNASQNNIPLKFLVYIISYDDRVVRLSFGTIEPLFDKTAFVFEKMAGSYKSLDQPAVTK